MTLNNGTPNTRTNNPWNRPAFRAQRIYAASSANRYGGQRMVSFVTKFHVEILLRAKLRVVFLPVPSAHVSHRSSREAELRGQASSDSLLGNVMQGVGEDWLLLPCLAASDRKEVIC